MKAIGKRSISSFLAVLLTMAWCGIALVLGVTVLAGVLGSPLALHISPSGAPSVEGYDSGVRMMIPVSFHFDSEMKVTSPSLGVRDAKIENVHGSLKFPLARGPLFFTNFVLVIALLSAALWAIGQLRAFFLTLRDGQPFVPANAARIRRIAWAVILGELARAAVVWYEGHYAMTHFQAEGFHFAAQAEINFFVIVCGLVLLVIAEVFGIGTRLDEEQSLTV
jgi:hypothetical protein